MAALDSKFYRLLFKAVDQFKPNQLQSWAKITDSGRTYFVFKKPALKLFRLLTPWYEGSTIKDDNQLIDKLFIDRKTNQALINLAEPSSPTHPDQLILNEWDKLNNLSKDQQEKAHNQLATKIASAPVLAPARTRPGIKPPGIILDLASRAKQFIIRHPIIPLSFFSGLVGSIVATEVSGPGAVVPGFIGGAALPSLVKIGLLNKLPGFSNEIGPDTTETREGGLSIGQLSRLLSNSRLGGALQAAGGIATVGTSIWLWVIVLGIIILLPLLFMLIQTTSQIGPEGISQEVGIQPSSDISSCEFLNHGRYYRIGSSKLRNLISEVAEKTNIPPAVLTAIAIQETANFAVQATDNHPAFSEVNYSSNGCDPYFKTSPTGALGLMQVQPPPNISTYGTNYSPNSVDIEGIKIGLRFINRDYNGLTKNDFCDIRTNLYLGAGVIINKNGGQPPKTAEQIEKTACKYHGACNIGTFDYAGEVRQGFEECRLIPVSTVAEATDCPIQNGQVLCGSQFTPINNCGHCGLNYGPTQYCSYLGTKYSIDISGKPLQQVTLPKVNGHLIQWDYIGAETGSTQAIIKYAGTDMETNKKYFLQIHHSEIGSGNPGTHLSGELGAKICSSCDHTHIQIGDGGTSQTNINWLDAAKMFCKKAQV